MNDCSVGALIVNNAGRMSGIFTERDVMRRVLAKRLDPASVTVAQVMTTDRVICCTPATSIEEARELMRSRRIRHLPILDAEGDVVGVVSIGDLNAHLATHQEVTIHYLEEYLHGRV
jgi:CBS domain-containing protein